MSKLDFIKKLYNGKNCYSDHMGQEELELLHIPSNIEDIIVGMLEQKKIVILTGNPGDGKTFIIKAIEERINNLDVYTHTDLSQVSDYAEIAKDICRCYENGQPAVLAVNEYPFLQLCKCLRQIDNDIYDEVMQIREAAITYDIPRADLKRIAVIDLNERTLLDRDRHLTEEIIDRVCDLLLEDDNISKTIAYNIEAVKNPFIRKQLLGLFDLAVVSCNHFSARDILGAVAYIMTACEIDDFDKPICYYEAIFLGDNSLLKAIQNFDPIYLTKPSLDEELWTGTKVDGWYVSAPDLWPSNDLFDDDLEGAVELFQSIKRRYYFENSGGEELYSLQPSEIENCTALFVNFERDKRVALERFVKAINKLFLPSSNDKKLLRVWTTHRYNMSNEPSTAVSSKYVSTRDLELQMPRPSDWLRGMEFMPDHLLLKPKDREAPLLKLDIDFIRTLDAINAGYPVSMLAPQYSQAASMFLQKLNEVGVAEENDNGQIIIASRKRSYQKSIYIQDGKYSFDEEDE